MTTPSKPEREHVAYHKDGSVRAKGMRADGLLTGYWQWFRKDGTRLRSGHFEHGEQVAEWITYDQHGRKWRVTNLKRPAKKA